MRVSLFLTTVATSVAVGPIEKVVQLLTQLKSQVQADQELEAEAFDKQDKWCRSTVKDKEHAIEVATDLIEEKAACIEDKNGVAAAKTAMIEELGAHIAAHERDLKAATQIRESEHTSFNAMDKELSDTIDAIERAIVILKRSGVGKTGQASSPALSQLTAKMGLLATTLTTVVGASWVPMQDRKQIQQFLQNAQEGIDFENPEAAAYEGRSGSIIDVLVDLRDKADESQHTARKQEMEAKHNFDMLHQDITDQTGFAKKELSGAQSVRSAAEETRSACEGVKANSEESKKDDTSYLGQLKVSCKLQDEEFVRNTESREAEIQAITEGIAILSDDTHSDSFNRLGKSLLQTSARDYPNVHRAQALLDNLGKELHSVALTQVAYKLMVSDPSDPFGKVRGMIAGMIARLEKESIEEADHKSWCDEETRQTEEGLNKSKNRLAVLDTRIEKASADIAQLELEGKELEKQIAQIDEETAEAISNRQQNKAANEAQIKDAETSQSAVRQAMTVLRDYYSGKTSEAEKEAELLQVGRKLPTAIEARDHTDNASAATNIIGLLEVVESDFMKIETETKALEDQQMNDFRALIQKNKVSRATKVASVKGKRATVKSLSNSKAAYSSDLNNEQDNFDALSQYRSKLRKSCEYTVPSFEERAAQRQAEIAGLKEALKILQGDAPLEALVQSGRVLRGAKRH